MCIVRYIAVAVLGFLFSFFLQAEELRIFPLHQAKTEGNSFVDISDQQIWPYEKILKIRPSKRYRLKKNKENDWDYHKLSYKKSGEILKALNIKLEDKIYIYNLELDKVTSIKVKNKLPLLVHQNPYDSGEEGAEYYFGFEIANHDYPIKKDDYRDGYLVYIGSKNPFTKNNLERIIWEKTSSDHFPTAVFNRQHGVDNTFISNEDYEEGKDAWGNPQWQKKSYKKDTYQFLKDDLEYTLYFLTRSTEMLDNEAITTYSHESSYFIQVKQKDGTIVLELFRKSSESVSVLPFEEETKNHWAGKLFKDKPAVFYNSTESYSFGCPSIHVTGSTSERVLVLCNNRH